MSSIGLTLLFLFSLSLAYELTYDPETTGASTTEEARRTIASSIMARRLKHGPVKFTRHMEVNQQECSDYCKDKGGNGACNEECYTPGCLFDFGDCPARPYRECYEMRDLCSPDRCNSDCYLAGCPSSCEEDGFYAEFIYVFTPYILPEDFYVFYTAMEDRIHEKSGLVLSLQKMYGLTDGAKEWNGFLAEPYAMIWLLAPKRMSEMYNSTVAIFKVERGYFSPKDGKTLDILKKLGGEKYVAQVVPMILAPAQYDLFSIWAEHYNDRRVQYQQVKGDQKNFARLLEECPRDLKC